MSGSGSCSAIPATLRTPSLETCDRMRSAVAATYCEVDSVEPPGPWPTFSRRQEQAPTAGLWVVVKLGVLCLGVLLLVLVSGEFGNSNSLLKEASGRWALRQ